MSKNKTKARPVPAGIQFISIAAYAAFAIPVTIIALDQAWFAGVGLAVIFAVFWPKMPKAVHDDGLVDSIAEAIGTLRPNANVSEPAAKPSGNASFDAYKAEMMDRLEKEQANFENFLTRLRAAKDKSEFDDFMEDRAMAARSATIESGSDDVDTAPLTDARSETGPVLRQPA